MKKIVCYTLLTLMIVSCIPKRNTADEYKLLANAYISKGKLRKASKALTRAAVLNKKDPDIYVTLAEVYFYTLKNDYKSKRKIQKAYNDAMRIINWYEPALMSRSHYYYNIGEYADALTNLDSLLIKYPGNADAYLLQAKIFYHRKDTASGNRICSQALKFVSQKDRYKVYQDKAYYEFNLGLYEKSVEDYSNALKLADRGQFYSYCELGWAYQNIGKVDSACHYYKLCNKQRINHKIDRNRMDKLCKE